MDVINWLKLRNSAAHAIVAVILSGAGLIVSDAEFRSQVVQFFSAHPKIGSEIIAAAGIIVTYMKATKQTPPKLEVRETIAPEP